MPNFYVDEMIDWGAAKGSWCHLWTDGTDADLNAFAQSIGLKLAWAQESHGLSGRFYHYDLRASVRAKALRAGAKETPLKEWVRRKLQDRLTGDLPTITLFDYGADQDYIKEPPG